MLLIIFNMRPTAGPSSVNYSPGPWRDLEARLSRAVSDLEGDNFNWKYVEGAGLVRDSLTPARTSRILSFDS
jgi:hypothetical protein